MRAPVPMRFSRVRLRPVVQAWRASRRRMVAQAARAGLVAAASAPAVRAATVRTPVITTACQDCRAMALLAAWEVRVAGAALQPGDVHRFLVRRASSAPRVQTVQPVWSGNTHW